MGDTKMCKASIIFSKAKDKIRIFCVEPCTFPVTNMLCWYSFLSKTLLVSCICYIKFHAYGTWPN